MPPFEYATSSAASTESYSGFDLSGVEKMHIQKVLKYTKGNKTETSRLLGIGLTTLYRKIEEYGLLVSYSAFMYTRKHLEDMQGETDIAK